MNNTCKKDLYNWLRDAYTVEQQAEALFNTQADRLKDFPGIHSKLVSEANYAKLHQKMLSMRISQLGAGVPITRYAADKIVVDGEQMSGMTMSDEPVKEILALYTFVQMEFASFKILAKAAEILNDIETKDICDVVVAHVDNRSHWLEDELDRVTRTFLMSKAA